MWGIFKLEMEAWEEGEVPGMKKCAQDSVYQAGVKFQVATLTSLLDPKSDSSHQTRREDSISILCH